MLVLKRKTGEAIIIGDEKIVVTVVEVRESKVPGRGSVRVSIEAPHWVHVYRKELDDKERSS